MQGLHGDVWRRVVHAHLESISMVERSFHLNIEYDHCSEPKQLAQRTYDIYLLNERLGITRTIITVPCTLAQPTVCMILLFIAVSNIRSRASRVELDGWDTYKLSR